MIRLIKIEWLKCDYALHYQNNIMLALGAVKLMIMDFTTVIHYMATVLNLDCFNNSALYMIARISSKIMLHIYALV